MTSGFELGVIALLVGGAFFGLVATVGLIRLPDFYTRVHAASKSDTLSVILSLGAVVLLLDTPLSTVKTLLLLVFMFVTTPTATHAIARAAYDQGIAPWTIDSEDDA